MTVNPNKPLKELPHRVHHSARIISDQEQNRRLVEGVLGIPLTATWIEHVPDYEDPSKKVVMCHTFYELADGSALAFFAFDKPGHWRRVVPALKERTGQYDHTALKVSRGSFDELVERLKSAAYPHRVLDHGYCVSLYVTSDQGYTLEFAYDADNAEAIREWQRRTAHDSLQLWTDGQRKPNNAFRSENYAS